MEHFLVMYDSRVVIYERKMFIRLATGHTDLNLIRAQTFYCWKNTLTDSQVDHLQQ